ncbi:MAG: hypothetical protein JWN67_427 [Actinomycetia bacterium]|nr:hypothetical protein [Actinomycetes bacterium]
MLNEEGERGEPLGLHVQLERGSLAHRQAIADGRRLLALRLADDFTAFEQQVGEVAGRILSADIELTAERLGYLLITLCGFAAAVISAAGSGDSDIARSVYEHVDQSLQDAKAWPSL